MMMSYIILLTSCSFEISLLMHGTLCGAQNWSFLQEASVVIKSITNQSCWSMPYCTFAITSLRAPYLDFFHDARTGIFAFVWKMNEDFFFHNFRISIFLSSVILFFNFFIICKVRIYLCRVFLFGWWSLAIFAACERLSRRQLHIKESIICF